MENAGVAEWKVLNKDRRHGTRPFFLVSLLLFFPRGISSSFQRGQFLYVTVVSRPKEAFPSKRIVYSYSIHTVFYMQPRLISRPAVCVVGFWFDERNSIYATCAPCEKRCCSVAVAAVWRPVVFFLCLFVPRRLMWLRRPTLNSKEIFPKWCSENCGFTRPLTAFHHHQSYRHGKLSLFSLSSSQRSPIMSGWADRTKPVSYGLFFSFASSLLISFTLTLILCLSMRWKRRVSKDEASFLSNAVAYRLICYIIHVDGWFCSHESLRREWWTNSISLENYSPARE